MLWFSLKVKFVFLTGVDCCRYYPSVLVTCRFRLNITKTVVHLWSSHSHARIVIAISCLSGSSLSLPPFLSLLTHTLQQTTSLTPTHMAITNSELLTISTSQHVFACVRKTLWQLVQRKQDLEQTEGWAGRPEKQSQREATHRHGAYVSLLLSVLCVTLQIAFHR